MGRDLGAETFDWTAGGTVVTVLFWGDVVRTPDGVVVPPDSVVILRSA